MMGLWLAVLAALHTTAYAADLDELSKQAHSPTFLISASCIEVQRNFEPGPRSPADLKATLNAAESGNPYCQVLLGNWYEYGKGVQIDYEKARLLYSSASNKINGGAVALGKMAELGHGMPVSYSQA